MKHSESFCKKDFTPKKGIWIIRCLYRRNWRFLINCKSSLHYCWLGCTMCISQHKNQSRSLLDGSEFWFSKDHAKIHVGADQKSNIFYHKNFQPQNYFIFNFTLNPQWIYSLQNWKHRCNFQHDFPFILLFSTVVHVSWHFIKIKQKRRFEIENNFYFLSNIRSQMQN